MSLEWAKTDLSGTCSSTPPHPGASSLDAHVCPASLAIAQERKWHVLCCKNRKPRNRPENEQRWRCRSGVEEVGVASYLSRLLRQQHLWLLCWGLLTARTVGVAGRTQARMTRAR